MANSSSQDELPTRKASAQTFLESLQICVRNADHRALEEHLMITPAQQSDLDSCLLFGLLDVVQRENSKLSHIVHSLTTLLQSGAKWNSDALLDEQKTPYHIICQATGDLHELLDLMIKSSQQTIIDARDYCRHTALMYAVDNLNINCIKCLIAHGADVTIGDSCIDALRPITKAIILIETSSYSPVILSDMLDMLINVAADQNKEHFRSCTDYIEWALKVGNVNCVNKLIKLEAPLDVIGNNGMYVWARVATQGDVELLKSMFNRGFNKNSIDQDGWSVLAHAVGSGHIEAVRYLLDLGVDTPTYSPVVHETQCDVCKENMLIMEDQSLKDPCLIAICENRLEIVKLLEEHGSQSCESFNALRLAVENINVDVVSYLLNKYIYPLNIEYRENVSGGRALTLLTEDFFSCPAQILKLLLTHGADPTKPVCAARSVNAIMARIRRRDVSGIATFIRSGIDMNITSWDSTCREFVSPFEASVMHDHPKVSLMLLVTGCSRGVFGTGRSKVKPDSRLGKMMKEWNVYDNNVTPLMQRCRCVILNHLCPRADMKIGKLPLPKSLTRFLGVPELDYFISEYNGVERG